MSAESEWETTIRERMTETEREVAQDVVARLHVWRLTAQPGTRKGDRPLNQAYHLDRCNREASRMYRGMVPLRVGFERRVARLRALTAEAT